MHRDTTTDAARRTEDGQTMAEYAIVLAVITIGIMLSIQLLGNTAGGLIELVAERLD
jgi:Flp pilus assembly pilin Flp